MRPHPRIEPLQRLRFGAIARSLPASTEEPLQPADRGRLTGARKVDVDEHHAGGVEHETAERVPGDHRGGTAIACGELAHYLLAHRALAVKIRAGRLAALRGARGDLFRRHARRGPRVVDAQVRAAPAGEDERPAVRRSRPRGSLAPVARKLHFPRRSHRGCRNRPRRFLDGDESGLSIVLTRESRESRTSACSDSRDTCARASRRAGRE